MLWNSGSATSNSSGFPALHIKQESVRPATIVTTNRQTVFCCLVWVTCYRIQQFQQPQNILQRFQSVLSVSHRRISASTTSGSRRRPAKFLTQRQTTSYNSLALSIRSDEPCKQQRVGGSFCSSECYAAHQLASNASTTFDWLSIEGRRSDRVWAVEMCQGAFPRTWLAISVIDM